MGNSPRSRENYNQKRREQRAKHYATKPLMDKIVALTRTPISFEDLCDRLDRSPSVTRKLLETAKAKGIRLSLGNDHIQLSGEEQVRTIQDTLILPTTGEKQRIGVISDTHFGSKYCLRPQIKDCIHYMYDQGIREILHPGDVLDGCYKHGVFELSHSGLEDQTQDLIESLPKLKGLTYHAITGNHDFTFTSLTGANVGKYIERAFKSAGRSDIKFYGDRGAFLEIRGAVIHLWHPLGGKAYSKSYRLQKQIESYSPAQKPHILLAGHWHDFAVVESRGVFGVCCPTFQGSGSAFSRALGGDVSLGGLIVSWEIAGEDMVRNFGVERRRYFEVEVPQKVGK